MNVLLSSSRYFLRCPYELTGWFGRRANGFVLVALSLRWAAVEPAPGNQATPASGER
jgi:hypothetical protein